ncbi:MAG: ABC transporter permease [Bacteroidales bacterium]|jgi:putative ABC transport system permease protein|nr:ABC transporter permease [Bacteroidales bacterium]
MHYLLLIKESFLFAFNALKVNRLRTLLTLLGITIGIFAIISVFTVVDSLENNIKTSLSSLGDDVVYVQKWPWAPEPGQEYAWWEYLNRPLPSLKEYEHIKKRSEKALYVNFAVSTMRKVKYKNLTATDVIIWANTHDFEKIRTFELESGRYFTPFESTAGKNICLIGDQISKDLFKGLNPVGKEIKIQGRKITIVGKIKKEGKDILNTGGSLDEMIILPVNFAKTLIDIKSDNANPMIMVKAKEGITIAEFKDELRSILRSVRTLHPQEKDNFALNQSSILDSTLKSIFGVINLAGWLIGGFSILVGGFGIANIMFVSVKERTNLIGIQKALGAKRFFILFQFLFESVLLSLIGGIIGLFLNFMGSLLANTQTELTITLTLGNILLGLTISIIIGIISGFAPARSAARLNPVEAINTAF